MKNRNIFIFAISLTIFFLSRHFLFFNRGLSLFEEGYFYYLYDSILKGKLLYKDLYAHTLPPVNYFFAALIKIFPNELLTIRTASIILTTGAVVTAFFILKQYIEIFWAAIGALISFSLYYLWWYSYGYEFGSLFCFLSLYISYLWIKEKKNIYLILTIISVTGALGYSFFVQGGPLLAAILIGLLIFRKETGTKKIALLLISVSSVYILIMSYFMFKTPLNNILTMLMPFLHYDMNPALQVDNTFPFHNVFKAYKVTIPEKFALFNIYPFIKGLFYVFIYYLPIYNIIILFLNRSSIYKKLNTPLKYLYVSLFLYSIFSYVRIYKLYPDGHSDAFFVAPGLLFLFLNIYFIIENAGKKINSVTKKKILKTGIVLFLFLLYFTIQTPNLNPELNQSELQFDKINGVKSSTEVVNYIGKVIKSIEKYSDRGDYIYARSAFLINVSTGRPDILEGRMLLLRLLIADYKDDTIQAEKAALFQKSFIEKIITKNCKILCMDSDILKEIDKKNLNELKNIISEKYELKDHFTLDRSKQKFEFDWIDNVYIYVLKEN